jgi:phage terminase large subunit-like protein
VKGQRFGDWLLLNLPATSENRDERGNPVEDLLGREPGQALWGERYDEAELARIRRDVGERVWASLYQQRPRPLEGVLWKEEWINAARWSSDWGAFDINLCQTVVVGVDPTGSVTGDECGIVVVGSGYPRDPCPCGADPDESPLPHGYVLADYSGHYTPVGWAKRVSYAYNVWDADRIVAEINFGHDLVARNMTAYDPDLPVKEVRASRGKAVRAEPVATLYQNHRIHHVGNFGDLEDELLAWRPDSLWSPNRLDGLVWGITANQLTGRRARLLGTGS